VSGSPALPWTTPGSGRLRREPGAGGAALHAARPGWPCARRPLTTPRQSRHMGAGRRRAQPPRRCPGPGRRRTRPRGRQAGVLADQEDRTTAPGPRLRLGLPSRPVPRTALQPERDRVVWAASLPCSGPLTHGQHAATAPPTATPRRRVLQALKWCARRRSRRSRTSVRAARSWAAVGRGVLGLCPLAGLAVQRDRPPAPCGQREEADRDRDRGLGGEDQVGDEVQHAVKARAMAPVPAIASRLPLRTIASLSPSRKRRRRGPAAGPARPPCSGVWRSRHSAGPRSGR
jgi:hypothetical protein